MSEKAPWSKGFEMVENPSFNPDEMKLAGVPDSVRADISVSSRKDIEKIKGGHLVK